jgi:hypothetical protein
MPQFRKLAMRTWHEAGITLPYGATGEIDLTCPECSHTRKKWRKRDLAVNVTKGLWFCHHCGWRGRLSDPDYAVPTVRLPQLPTKADYIMRLWHEAQPLTWHDPVTRYLGQRQISFFSIRDYPQRLRYHPALAYTHPDGTKTRHPAMVALYHGPDGKVAGLHRTYLDTFGFKADLPDPKRVLRTRPGVLAGAVIRLYPATEILAIGEGIETMLSVRVLTGLPVWAAGSAHQLASVQLPSWVAILYVCADHDRDHKGEGAAYRLAWRYRHQCSIKIATPETLGDWQDVLERQRKATP